MPMICMMSYRAQLDPKEIECARQGWEHRAIFIWKLHMPNTALHINGNDRMAYGHLEI